MASVIWLSDADAADRARAGGKGASLARLIGWGLPVPPGFVVPSDATAVLLRTAVADAQQLPAAELQARVLAAPLPPPLAQAIADAYRQLGGAVAVRSSATAEDSATASFAGQQDTYLDVEGEDAVVAKVRSCLASLFTERALAYRAHKDAWQELGIAVVVQRMVPATKAGVAFTRDPVQGKEHVVVEAVPGNGESLVSGEAVPDHYEVHRGTRAIVSRFSPVGREPVLTDRELAEVVALSLGCEELFAAPQDLEWAISDRLYLLQSRPITTL
jgi:phosphoenolpyruvate synthase/pyruvate phosphate dikinase